MSRPRAVFVSLVAVLALGAVACQQQEPEFTAEDQVAAEDRPDEAAANGDTDAAADAEETHLYVAVDNDFTEFPTQVAAGTVAFELDNQGNLPHDVTIEELGDEIVVEADGGETATGTVTLEPGTYTVYCSVPGHRATMEEELTVE